MIQNLRVKLLRKKNKGDDNYVRIGDIRAAVIISRAGHRVSVNTVIVQWADERLINEGQNC